MKDYLLDIVKHTHNTGVISLIKVTGTAEETSILGMGEQGKPSVLMGKFHKPVPEFIGTFGMPHLNKLDMLLKCSEYQENEKLEMIRKDNKEKNPVAIHFENESGDFQNDFRLMNHNIVEEKLQNVSFFPPTWDAELVPSIAGVQRLQFQSSVHSEEPVFVLNSEGDKLICSFGDAANHAGRFTFATGVKGKVSAKVGWPIASVSAILRLTEASNCTIKISNSGLMHFNLDSGLAEYNYYVPGQAK